jgi:hypothetical protein
LLIVFCKKILKSIQFCKNGFALLCYILNLISYLLLCIIIVITVKVKNKNIKVSIIYIYIGFWIENNDVLLIYLSILFTELNYYYYSVKI